MQPLAAGHFRKDLSMTERVLRTETISLKAKTDRLQKAHAIDRLWRVYTKIGALMDQLFGMHQIEKRLSETFGIERCLIASGDGDRQPKVIAEFGQLLNESLDLLLPESQKHHHSDGRTTMAKVAEVGNLETAKRHNLFVQPVAVSENQSTCKQTQSTQ